MDPSLSLVSALAIRGRRILAVGEAALEASVRSQAQVIDLEGRTVLPGLTDSHIHFGWFARALRQVDLTGARSLNEMLDRVTRRAERTPTGSWIRGRGWDQELWSTPRFPTAADLDRVTVHQPVFLTAKSGHAAVANSLALRQAGIGGSTPDPAGGRIERDAAGVATGLLLEEPAMVLVSDTIPEPDPETLASWVLDAFERAWRVGLTGIHDVDTLLAFDVYQRLRAQGELGLRIVKYLPKKALEPAQALHLRAGLGDDWLRIGGLKLFADGALGPRTAAMLAPYAGEPANTGILVTERAELEELARRSVAGGLALAIHAIGDRANRMVLDIISQVAGNEASLRHRIEHAQLVHPDDVGRFAKLGVVASMQPIHAPQDARMVDRYWGERAAGAYAWRSLLNAGTVLAFGSDCPVEDLNPFLGIHAAVTRSRPDGYGGADGWRPEQRLTVEEAVWAYTQGAAYAAGAEDRLGSLTPGKLADLVVIDRQIFTGDPDRIAETEVVGTMIDGRWVYGRWTQV
jgi:predicted amidohydrolase YtcJ